MNRRSLLKSIASLCAASLAVLTGTRANAAEYKYKCTRSGQIHTYSKKGNYKCPEHPNHNLTPVN